MLWLLEPLIWPRELDRLNPAIQDQQRTHDGLEQGCSTSSPQCHVIWLAGPRNLALGEWWCAELDKGSTRS